MNRKSSDLLGNGSTLFADKPRVINGSTQSNLPVRPKVLSKVKKSLKISQFLIKASPTADSLVSTKYDLLHQSHGTPDNFTQASSPSNPMKKRQPSQYTIQQKIRKVDKNDQTESLGTTDDGQYFPKKYHLRSHSVQRSAIDEKKSSTAMPHQILESQASSSSQQNQHPKNRIQGTIRRQGTARSVSVDRKNQILDSSCSVPIEHLDRSAVDGKHLLMENRFYHFCAQEIVKLSKQNAGIESEIESKGKQLESALEKNKKLQLLIEGHQAKQDIYKKQIELMNRQRELLEDRIKSHRCHIEEEYPKSYRQKYKKMLADHKMVVEEKNQAIVAQRQKINRLKGQIKQEQLLNLEVQEVKRENQALKKRVEEMKQKGKSYDEKIFAKNSAICHLQQVKDLQFENLLSLVKESVSDIGSSQATS